MMLEQRTTACYPTQLVRRNFESRKSTPHMTRIADLRLIFGILLVALLCLHVTVCAIPVTKDMETFSSVVKGGMVYRLVPQTVFEIENTTGVVTHLWFTIRNKVPLMVSVFVDGEADPSILCHYQEGFGMTGFYNDQVWGTNHAGRGGRGGGVYSAMRIPFGSSLKVVVYLEASYVGDGENFFFIVHGMKNYPTIVGDLQLPSNARVRLHSLINHTAEMFDYTTLVNSTGKSGLLYAVSLSASSNLLIFLEACMRAYIDGSTTPMFLSSGTEDYFNSADYFDGGPFEFDSAGCTSVDHAANMVSAYRVHAADPVVWHQSFELVWRNSEDFACPMRFPATPENSDKMSRDQQTWKNGVDPLSQVTFNSYAWVYEW